MSRFVEFHPGQDVFAGAQDQYPGLDQINIEVPSSLGGAGEVNLSFTADGIATNTVKIRLQ